MCSVSWFLNFQVLKVEHAIEECLVVVFVVFCFVFLNLNALNMNGLDGSTRTDNTGISLLQPLYEVAPPPVHTLTNLRT